MRKAEAVVRVESTIVRDEVAIAALPKLWVPKANHMLLIELPGERLRASVVKVVNPDVVICELTDIPLMQNKSHQYGKSDLIPCERIENGIETIWRAFRPLPKEPEAEPPAKRKRKAKNAS